MAATVLLLCALAAAPSAHLSEGIRLYKAQNYSEALAAFTHAIDEPNSSHDKARIHVYIGLIQFRFSMKSDASASFERALDYDAKLELSKKHAPAARRLFAKIKRDRFGDDRPIKKKGGRRSKRSHDEPPGSEAKLESEPDPVADPPPPSESTIAVAPPPPSGTVEAAPPPTIAPPPPPPPQIAPPVTVTTEPGGSSLELPGWITLGAGAAAILAAGVLTGVAVHNFNEAPKEGYADDAKARFDAAVDQRTGAIASVSVGVVGVGVGITLLLIE